ncbi:unnamed protein product [Spirodela intermedia]|uniref:Uncharacterized protein n=1 Tax=Spirodela intermedia TaxID=51605 RepID=A0A7I8K843_SPIIN|nr:unnamed protein product [Spirodela intermedia]
MRKILVFMIEKILVSDRRYLPCLLHPSFVADHNSPSST